MKRKLNRYVVCADRFRMSVQAGDSAYCTPRINGASCYSQVEVGYPNASEPLLMNYAEDPSSPTNTVYPYVPVETVTNVILKHGGFVEGEVPPGVYPLEPTCEP